MAPTPYWGSLPPPKIVRGDSVKNERQRDMRDGRDDRETREVGDKMYSKMDPNGRNDLSIDTKPGRSSNRFSSQSSRRPDRNSIQTEAPTVSTQSPFVSPTDSSFGVRGLAPRPPSFPYEAPAPAPTNHDYLEKRRRRESRNREQAYEDQAPPAAPDVPRAPPPVSYKQPYNGGQPARSRSARRSEGPVISSQGVADEYYRSHPREGNSTSVSRRGSAQKGRAGPHDEPEWDSTVPERIDVPHRQGRQGSVASQGESQRRREWAPDRSPLQRLELTLDSITKEEKRARVEEAERTSKTERNGEKGKQNSVRFRNRPVAKAPEGGIKSEPQDIPDPAAERVMTAKQIEPAKIRKAQGKQKAVDVPAKRPTRGFDYEEPEDTRELAEQDISSPPRRGQSGRDRSYIPVAVGAAAGVVGAQLGRSGSNRLKKEPPGDPWLHLRVEAENQYPEVLPPKQPVIVQKNGGTSREAAIRSNPRGLLDKELPPPPTESAQQLDSYSSDDMGGKPVRRKTLSKVQQLTGQNFSEGALKSIQPGKDRATESVKVNGTKYGLPFTRSASNATRDPLQSESVEHHHHLPDMVHRHQENMPGQGVYVPSARLDEWKKGGVAQLSGSLLDLESDEQIELDKDKAWWEAGNTGKRRRSSTKPRRAEAYDGEYDDNNGTESQISPSKTNCDECDCAEKKPVPGVLKVLTKVKPRQRHYLGYDRKGKSMQGKATGDTVSESFKDTSTNLLSVPSRVSPSKSLENLSLKYFNSSSSNIHKLTCPMRGIRVRPEIAPTRFKPPLFMRAGPMLRYCGLRREPAPSRAVRALTGVNYEREIWRGTIMIVTQDEQSSYELAPTLRVFLQPMDLLPPPPAQVDGAGLAPEYVDPLAGLPKIGRDGRTLYVRPVEELEEERDLSKEESDDGLFETQRSNLDGSTDRKCAKPHYDGEKAGKYKEVRGFRLHTEQGVTFWRFNLEIELRDRQQRIAYRINRGPATGFWVPARGQPMNIMYSSCNGFSYGTDPNPFNGPDPLWRDVLNNHQTQPFHVMLGGGDQIYNDAVMEETRFFKDWTRLKDRHYKENVPFTPEIQQELESFYLNRYCMWFSQGLFGLAMTQIPMINIYDDHDIIDGYGSYPDGYMKSPVMRGLGAIAFKYYMLFQHQSSIDEGEETEPQWILGEQPGPYMGEVSRSIFTELGRSIAFLGLDCRTERMADEIVSTETYYKVFDRLEKDLIKGVTKHLIVMLGVPVAYPRMVWLENILTSRAMQPIKALGRAGLLGKNLLNHFDGGVEILDDLDDHWTAKMHKEERNWFIQELQDLAAEKSVRVTILGGDVHLGAIGQFYSNPKLGISKDKDHRYMPNVISSAIVNAPPPDTLADVLNKRNKIHHLDEDTYEDMIPIFTHDVNGKPRNNKCLLNRRNWCSIRPYDPELSPPPTPQTDGSRTPPPVRGGLLRRLSTTARGPSYRVESSGPPPLSNQGFFNRKPSVARRGSNDSERPGLLTRTLSLTRRGSTSGGGGLFRRSSKKRKPDSGGINGYGEDSEDDSYSDDYQSSPHSRPRQMGIRGGAGSPVGSPEEEGYFPDMPSPCGREPEHPTHTASTSIAGGLPQKGFNKRNFHRTPTGLSEKQRRGARGGPIDLEGGLDICLNMEVSPKDPAGITMPYRLLVPALWYEERLDGEAAEKVKGGLERWVSFARKKGGA